MAHKDYAVADRAGALIDAAEAEDRAALLALLSSLHPADLAEQMERFPENRIADLMALIGADLAPDYLADLSSERRERVLEALPADYVARALNDLDTDDAAAIAADLDEAKLAAALRGADDETRMAVEANLAAEEETAGRLMQREFVAAPEFWSVGQTIDHMRANESQLPDRFFEIYVVDPSFRPIGVVELSTLLRCKRETPLQTLMRAPQVKINPEMDQEDVAFAFQKYHLASAPVIDGGGRLTGMLTVDDIVHVISEESQEDLLRLSGVSEGMHSDTVFRTMRARLPWLVLNMGTALIAASVISRFEGAIERYFALAVLMPIVASLGGNAGSQALAVAVRALAGRSLTFSNAWRAVAREALTGAANGLAVACLLGGVSAFWFQDWLLGMVVGGAILINLTAAGLAGILMPLALKRFGADPAVSSSVLVTFITDTIGFLSILGLATLILLR